MNAPCAAIADAITGSSSLPYSLIFSIVSVPRRIREFADKNNTEQIHAEQASFTVYFTASDADFRMEAVIAAAISAAAALAASDRSGRSRGSTSFKSSIRPSPKLSVCRGIRLSCSLGTSGAAMDRAFAGRTNDAIRITTMNILLIALLQSSESGPSVLRT